MNRQSALLSFLWLTCIFGVQSAWAENPHSYLALGDSLAFGYSPLVVPVGDLSQYHGYPQIVANQINRDLANASCFGETSGHFLNLAAEDLGCSAWRSAGLSLFVSYNGPQMDYALQYLRSHPKTDLVTIDIGINDLGVLLRDCKGDTGCAFAGLPAVLLAYQTNLTSIYTRIRLAGYRGRLVAVTAYAFNYADPLVTPAILALNSILSPVTIAFGGKVADAFTAFGTAAAPHLGDVCQTGLLVKFPDNTCDTHPSAKGHALIADLVLKAIGEGL